MSNKTNPIYLLLFYILATSKVIAGREPTCDGEYSWQLYNAAALGDQVAGPMTCYPTQLHYPDTEPTSPCPILIMPSARLGSDRYQFKCFWFDSTRFRTHRLEIRSSDSLISQERRALYSFGQPDCYYTRIPTLNTVHIWCITLLLHLQ